MEVLARKGPRNRPVEGRHGFGESPFQQLSQRWGKEARRGEGHPFVVWCINRPWESLRAAEGGSDL